MMPAFAPPLRFEWMEAGIGAWGLGVEVEEVGGREVEVGLVPSELEIGEVGEREEVRVVRRPLGSVETTPGGTDCVVDSSEEVRVVRTPFGNVEMVVLAPTSGAGSELLGRRSEVVTAPLASVEVLTDIEAVAEGAKGAEGVERMVVAKVVR